MVKARHVGKNLDTPSSPPAQTTNIEPAAEPTIVNATISAEPAPDIEVKSSYHQNEALQDIYAKRNKQLADLAPEEIEIEPTGGEAEAPPATEAEPLPPAAVPEVPVEEPPVAASPPQKYKVVVNGQNLEYTLEELQHQAQLGVAARQNFEEAARMRDEARRLSSQNFQPQPAVNNNTQAQLPDIPVDQELKDIVRRMNYGSEEEQVKAFQDAGILLNKQQGRNNPTPEQLVQVATQNAIAVLTTQQENGIIYHEYQDIMNDPALAAAADFTAGQLHQKYAALGQQKSRLDLLREAGNDIRAKFIKPAAVESPSQQPSAAPSPTVVTDNNKIERKRTAPQTPTSASAVAKTTGDVDSGASVEQIAHSMRKNAMSEILKARGQNVI